MRISCRSRRDWGKHFQTQKRKETNTTTLHQAGKQKNSRTTKDEQQMMIPQGNLFTWAAC